MKTLLQSVLTLSVLSVSTAYGQPTNYQVWNGQSNGQLVLRRWQQEGKNYYWMVNPKTLETTIAPDVVVQPLEPQAVSRTIAGTAYGRALKQEQLRAEPLQDAGIERTNVNEKGFSLTMDLCPSHKPLTRSVFEDLIAAFEPEEKPIPLTITITGLWIQTHEDDLEWLKTLEKRGDLRITWVNHSFHHYFNPKLPLTRNFLLKNGTNIQDEVLQNEQAMITHGLLPSIFFRFPGLISDRSIFDEILKLGLLPLGSDAWLAKGQVPQNGSIVLIHPNGNEPIGIADFVKLVKSKASSIRKKDWLLYDLPASLSK